MFMKDVDMRSKKLKIVQIITLLILCSCASYVTPGKSVNFNEIGSKANLMQDKQSNLGTDPILTKAAKVKPTLQLPANIVVARLQSRGYYNGNVRGVDIGKFSVVTTRDVEKDEDVEKIRKLKSINEIGAISPLLLSSDVSSDLILREAATKLNADLLFLYTFETTHIRNNTFPLLSLITLGLAPTDRYSVNTSLSAVLIDVRTGFVYGTLNETEKYDGLTISWNTDSALESARKKTEGKAFGKLVEELSPMWDRIIDKYTKGS
jgi:hypothetical protein